MGEKHIRRTSITGRLLLVAVTLLVVAIVSLAVISGVKSHESIRALMETRMLNITNAAAAMISGEDLDALSGKIEDSNKPEFKRITKIFSIFEKNVSLEYLYGLKKLDDGYGIVVENDLESADEYGEIIRPTVGLETAVRGKPSVEKNSYSDRWGRFYTAFSPVFNSNNKVVGVIGVDFNAEWYDGRVASQDIMTVLVCVITLVGSLILVLFITRNARRDVRRRRRESEEMYRVKKSIEGANLVKSKFIEHVSQETRTPIHTILDMSNKVEERANVERSRVCARAIHGAGENLLTMVNDVLEYSSIESGKIVISEDPYDLVSFVANISKTIRPYMFEKGLNYDINVDEVLPRYMVGDPGHISQCLINLLSNSVKYTEPGGDVNVSIFMQSIQGDSVRVRFSVEDTGIGISPEDMDRLTQPFEKVSHRYDDESEENEGTGLGLAVVQSLLKKMGSKLEIESLYGQGSIFYFTITQKMDKEDPLGDYEWELAKAESTGGDWR